MLENRDLLVKKGLPAEKHFLAKRKSPARRSLSADWAYMKRRRGTTLVELMTAISLSVLLLLAAVPVIMTGERIVRRIREKADISMAGDRIFSDMRERIMFGDEGTVLPDEEYETEFLDYGKVAVRMEAQEPECFMLTVEISREGEILYERTEEVRLLNRMNGAFDEKENKTGKDENTDEETDG